MENTNDSSSKGGMGEEKKWGTTQMGVPAAPEAHPENQQAASYWTPRSSDDHHYVLEHTPVPRPASSPMETILDVFNDWTKKAEDLSNNVWRSLKAAPSKSDAAWGKLKLTAKAITEGGFESLYKQTFPADPSEHLKKTFACYLSTATGPVAGTLYLSTLHLAFCSDLPLSFTAPSGQVAWSYYKVMIPLAKIANVNPVTVRENPPEKYIQIITVDGHEFWFMGFVSYDKAVTHLLEAVSNFAALNRPAEPPIHP